RVTENMCGKRIARRSGEVTLKYFIHVIKSISKIVRGELPVPTGRKREKGKGEEKEEN
ncbi:hypothetical protein SNEBB_002034, partial [Seison nebaliae]